MKTQKSHHNRNSNYHMIYQQVKRAQIYSKQPPSTPERTTKCQFSTKYCKEYKLD